MAITSVTFAGFVLAVLAVYHLVPGRVQRPWLLLASYAFCASWSPAGAGVLLAVTVLTYGLARALRAGDRVRRPLLHAGVALDLGALAFWKYAHGWDPA